MTWLKTIANVKCCVIFLVNKYIHIQRENYIQIVLLKCSKYSCQNIDMKMYNFLWAEI